MDKDDKSPIIRHSKNRNLKKLFSTDKDTISEQELSDILEEEHGRHLAEIVHKEVEIIKIQDELAQYKMEHSKSLALMVTSEAQKYELELLRSSLEAMANDLRRLSYLDGLTNIANRRYLDDFFSRAWRSALRDSQTLSVVMIDVDQFKRYNDYYGHRKGDECLVEIANVLKSFARRSKDLAARYGGEEFAVILTDANAEDSIKIAKNALEKIEALGIPHIKSDVSDVITVSVGVSMCLPDVHNSPMGLFDTADKALYQAKNSGRNTVHFEEYA